VANLNHEHKKRRFDYGVNNPIIPCSDAPELGALQLLATRTIRIFRDFRDSSRNAQPVRNRKLAERLAGDGPELD
jgi:hypothetical protein